MRAIQRVSRYGGALAEYLRRTQKRQLRTQRRQEARRCTISLADQGNLIDMADNHDPTLQSVRLCHVTSLVFISLHTVGTTSMETEQLPLVILHPLATLTEQATLNQCIFLEASLPHLPCLACFLDSMRLRKGQGCIWPCC